VYGHFVLCVSSGAGSRMSQWERLMVVCRNNDHFQRQLIQLYISVGFPIKIRSNLSHWIEAQDWLGNSVAYCLPFLSSVGVHKYAATSL